MKRVALTMALLISAACSSVAQDAHESHEHHEPQSLAPQALAPQQPGQAAFAALSEIVALLQADPKTDWSKVDITRLRNHLVDMDEVVMKATTELEQRDDEVRITYTGTGRTLEAIRRMLPAHARMMDGYRGWESATEPTKHGIVWILSTDSADEQARIRALGGFGLLTVGFHHGPHHLAMARGAAAHEH